VVCQGGTEVTSKVTHVTELDASLRSTPCRHRPRDDASTPPLSCGCGRFWGMAAERVKWTNGAAIAPTLGVPLSWNFWLLAHVL